MWNPFKKKEAVKNSLHEIAYPYLQGKKFHELDAVLQKQNISELNIKELETYYYLRGLCAFQQKAHAVAAEHLEEGLRHLPNNQLLMFSLGQEYVFLKQPQQAFELFDQCRFPDISREVLLTMSRYAYLFNEYERGIQYINQFLPYFLDLKILDDQFLYVRGIPFFQTYWNHLMVHCLLGNRLNILNQKYKEITHHCKGYDFAYLEFEQKAYVEKQIDELIYFLENAITEAKKLKLPIEYNILRMNCLKAVSSDSIEKANQYLDEVSRSMNTTYKSIYLLAKAAVEDKFQNKSACANEFLKEQPLLLEPNIALEFGLLDYQEKLKAYVGT